MVCGISLASESPSTAVNSGQRNPSHTMIPVSEPASPRMRSIERDGQVSPSNTPDGVPDVAGVLCSGQVNQNRPTGYAPPSAAVAPSDDPKWPSPSHRKGRLVATDVFAEMGAGPYAAVVNGCFPPTENCCRTTSSRAAAAESNTKPDSLCHTLTAVDPRPACRYDADTKGRTAPGIGANRAMSAFCQNGRRGSKR